MNTPDLAEGLDIHAIMAKATSKAQTKANLTPVFLKRESFAGTAISTSSLCIDKITGGGIPPSRVVGISGPERAGKSLLTTEILKNQVFAKGYCTYFDSEGASDPAFLKNRGIIFEDYIGKRTEKGNLRSGERCYLNLYQPSTGTEMLNYIDSVAKMLPEDRNPGQPPMIFMLDSVVALIPEAILDDVNKAPLAAHARMYSNMMPVVNTHLARTGCSFLYTNQLREKPGVTHGSPSYEPCGEALKFFSSMRIQLSSTKPKIHAKVDHPFVSGFIKGGEWKAGGVWQEPHYNKDGMQSGYDKYVHTAVRTVKNKVFTPYQVCWMRIQFEEGGGMGTGLDPVFDIFSFLLENDYIEKASLTEEEKAAKVRVAAVKDKYAITPGTNINLAKLFDMPERFDYLELKRWVASHPNLVRKMRQKMIVSGLVYNKDE